MTMADTIAQPAVAVLGAGSDSTDVLPTTLIALMKGIVERDMAPEIWQALLGCSRQVRDHIGVIGLDLVLDEAEGFAYLRQRPDGDGIAPLPRLVPRRQSSFAVSLLLALLRRRLAETDATSGDTKLVLARTEIHDLVRHLTKGGSNEAKRADKLDRDIDKIVDLGFLRPIRSDRDTFEVRRSLVAFVDAQWLNTFDQRLAAYAAHVAASRAAMDDA
jgi:hypothetical protein